jgi:hypothetical protein
VPADVSSSRLVACKRQPPSGLVSREPGLFGVRAEDSEGRQKGRCEDPGTSFFSSS